MTERDEFSAPVKRLLAERAAYRCSSPYCKRLTIGSSPIDSDKSLKPGVAAHICAARKNGPRFDSNQTAVERSAASNGIWLCVNCSVLVDKNFGKDFPSELLRVWKEQHELSTFAELINGVSEVGLTGWCEESSGNWKVFVKNPTMAPFLNCVVRGYKTENCDKPFADIELVFGTVPPRHTLDDTVDYEFLDSAMFGHPLIEIEYTDANDAHWCRDRFGKLNPIEYRRPFD